MSASSSSPSCCSTSGGTAAGFLRWEFIQNFPSRFPERAGFQSALWGSFWLVGTTALLAFPIGVGAAIYLEEYAQRSFWTRAIQTNIANLAGVPSIVFGILGLQLFVRGTIGIGPSIGAASGARSSPAARRWRCWSCRS